MLTCLVYDLHLSTRHNMYNVCIQVLSPEYSYHIESEDILHNSIWQYEVSHLSGYQASYACLIPSILRVKTLLLAPRLSFHLFQVSTDFLIYLRHSIYVSYISTYHTYV